MQLVRIGRLYLIGIPGEPTVVAGFGYGAPWPRSSAPSWPTSCASATAMPTSIT
ncbi:hydrolase domain protein [Mycobacterium ulcerans str. Harvey]|uniref:Hydrolase domain protein n=1 Tax=Mycobacterium ulcerans str. Harvey TaxID=1299332 RepID=A0ABP3AN19_MYCUL|nr:hydrolase domain protein [Mycobacterium ulcerans str. Harvey]